MSDTTQTQDPRATAPVDAGAAPANDATANAGDARSSAPPPAAHDAAASGADWLSGAPAQPEHFSLLDPFHKARVPFDARLRKASTGWCCTSARCSVVSACRWT